MKPARRARLRKAPEVPRVTPRFRLTDPGNKQPARISMRQIDACIGVLLEIDCVHAHAESTRCARAGDISSALLPHAIQACALSRVATRTEPDHLRAR